MEFNTTQFTVKRDGVKLCKIPAMIKAGLNIELRLLNFTAIVMEEHGMANGWPLGLEIMNIRLRVVDSLPAPIQPYSLHAPSNSFSSLSSSNLDTESTTSFFQDHSVSLGRLIGIRPGDRGRRLYFPNSIRFEEVHGGISSGVAHNSDVSGGEHGVDLCRRICIPLLLCALVKNSRSKSKCTR
ncbi:hypothetical protein FNV43_RR07532 [Rhamnella rubrinervis]|uniref:Uncharacterized protein n=1 Tax=Rhamnella rubrinervis TaxID=2594499 RepID=A0A8K0HF55_9ROSA|nr:hypothetical protein FNV43_RR07532 [Rhamnella rubrinervis]